MDIKRVIPEEILLAYPDHKDGRLTLPDGTITHWRKGKLHNDEGIAEDGSFGDIPAVVYPNDYGWEYYRKGLLHREPDPNGVLKVRPAVKLDSRLECYWWGSLHNIFGPAIHDVERNIQVWAQNGKKHRYKAPAVINEPKGYIGYWEMGVRHRIDGPARIWVLENRSEWWLKDKLLTDEEVAQTMECFSNSDKWPLLFGHPTLRPIAEFKKSGGRISKEPVSFK